MKHRYRVSADVCGVPGVVQGGEWYGIQKVVGGKTSVVKGRGGAVPHCTRQKTRVKQSAEWLPEILSSPQTTLVLLDRTKVKE